MSHAEKATPPWKDRQRQLREDALLNATAELMSVHGFGNTTMDAIANQVGISKPTLYQHFTSKNAIAEAVMLRNLVNAESRLAAVEASIENGAPARTQLEKHLRDAIGVHQGLWATRAHIPMELRDARKLRVRRQQLWDGYARIIDRCKEDGDCRTDIPTVLIVRNFVRVFRGDYADMLDSGEIDIETMARMLVSLLFDGMAPRSVDPVKRASVARTAKLRRGAAVIVGAFAMMSLAHNKRLYAQQPGTPATPAAQQDKPLVLADVLDAALRANPAARAAIAEARVANDQLDAARGSWFPLISFAPNFIVSQSNVGGTNSANTLNAHEQRITFSPSINLSYLLFDLGGRSGTVGAARQSYYAATFSRDVVVQQTVLETEQAYFGFQSARAVSIAQTDNVATAQASRDAAVARFQAGLGTVADTLQTSTALAQARVASVIARAALVNARAQLATAMGARADVPFRIAEEPAPPVDDVKNATMVLTAQTDTLIAHALRDRPDIGAANATLAAAGERVRVARSALLPSVQLGASTGQTLANQSTLTGGAYNVQIGLSLPLFDGGTRRAELSAAHAEVDAASARADAVRIDVVNAVVTSTEGLRLASEQVTTTDELLTSAVSSESVARGRYTEGVGTIVDLITAQTALANARSQAAQARWGWATSLSEFARNAAILGPRGQLPAAAAPSVPRTSLLPGAKPEISSNKEKN